MRKFREVLTLWFAPIVSVVLVVLKIEEVNQAPIRNSVPPWLIGALLAFGIIVVHVLTVISPYKRYEKLEKNKWVLFDYLARKLQEKYQDNFWLRINVMVPKWNFFYRLEPKKANNQERKLYPYGKVFKMAWDSEPVQSGKRLRITSNQGVCGMAYRNKRLYAKGLTKPPISAYNFTQYQYEETRNLVLVISCPI